jgi:hypothetical protein
MSDTSITVIYHGISLTVLYGRCMYNITMNFHSRHFKMKFTQSLNKGIKKIKLANNIWRHRGKYKDPKLNIPPAIQKLGRYINHLFLRCLTLFLFYRKLPIGKWYYTLSVWKGWIWCFDGQMDLWNDEAHVESFNKSSFNISFFYVV